MSSVSGGSPVSNIAVKIQKSHEIPQSPGSSSEKLGRWEGEGGSLPSIFQEYCPRKELLDMDRDPAIQVFKVRASSRASCLARGDGRASPRSAQTWSRLRAEWKELLQGIQIIQQVTENGISTAVGVVAQSGSV